MKRMLAVFMLSLVCLTACHTVRGFGEDVQAAGHAIKRSAER